jgi:hypothetical protein
LTFLVQYSVDKLSLNLEWNLFSILLLKPGECRKPLFERVGKKILVMKILFLSIFSLFIFLQSFSQEPETQVQDKSYYLKKSKNQKKGAWVLVGLGVGMTVGGILINLDQPFFGPGSNSKKGLWLSYVGVATTLGSIPLFISAHRNKKKAAALAFNYQNILMPYQTGLALKKQPAIVFKIDF